jgi:hypothetical protein
MDNMSMIYEDDDHDFYDRDHWVLLATQKISQEVYTNLGKGDLDVLSLTSAQPVKGFTSLPSNQV